MKIQNEFDMEKTNFWHDASKYGALLGLEEIVFLLLATLAPSGWFTLLNYVVFILLIYLFTKRRVTLYGGSSGGYSYGQCFKFIFFISLFAGILGGVYEVFARNVFFTETYQEILNLSKSVVMQFNVPGSDPGLMDDMMQRVMFSPFWILFSDILGLMIKGSFFGLFVAAFTRRLPSPFAPDDNDPE